MTFADPAGKVHDNAQLIQVSNNPYVLTRISGFGTHARLDTGTLGVSAVELRGATDVTRLIAAEAAGLVQRFRGYTEFASAALTVESDRPVEAGDRRRGRCCSTRPRVPVAPRRPANSDPHPCPGLLTGGAGATVEVVDAAGAVRGPSPEVPRRSTRRSDSAAAAEPVHEPGRAGASSNLR